MKQTFIDYVSLNIQRPPEKRGFRYVFGVQIPNLRRCQRTSSVSSDTLQFLHETKPSSGKSLKIDAKRSDENVNWLLALGAE